MFIIVFNVIMQIPSNYHGTVTYPLEPVEFYDGLSPICPLHIDQTVPLILYHLLSSLLRFLRAHTSPLTSACASQEKRGEGAEYGSGPIQSLPGELSWFQRG